MNSGGGGVCLRETGTVGDLRLVLGMCWVSRGWYKDNMGIRDSGRSAAGHGGCVGLTVGDGHHTQGQFGNQGVLRGGSGVCLEKTGTLGDLRLAMGICWDSSRKQVVVVMMLKDSMGIRVCAVGVVEFVLAV